MEKMSVAAEENKERLIRGDTFELKLEKISGNLSKQIRGERKAFQACGSQYTPRDQDGKSGVYSWRPWWSVMGGASGPRWRRGTP